MVRMKMRQENQPDVLKADTAAFERDQRGGAAIEQEVRLRAGDVVTGVEPAAASKGIATTDKPDLHAAPRERFNSPGSLVQELPYHTTERPF